MDLTEAERTLIQSALEHLRVAGLAVWEIAKQHEQKRLGKIAEAILKKHGALETEYGKIISTKARKPRRKKEERDGRTPPKNMISWLMTG